MLDSTRQNEGGPLEQAWASAFELRDLLKFEFFFSEKAEFRDELKAESRLIDPKFRQRVAKATDRKDVLLKVPMLMAHRVLPAFLEAYYIVADRLAAQSTSRKIDKKALIDECVTVGRQYVLQQRLRNPECVSREIFTNAISLAANRNLLDPEAPDLAQRRQDFFLELESAVQRVAAIEQLDQMRSAQTAGATT